MAKEPQAPVVATKETVLDQQKNVVGTLGAIAQTATSILTYGIASYFGVPFVAPIASAVGAAANWLTQYQVKESIESNIVPTTGHANTTLAKAAAATSRAADYIISYLPDRTQPIPTTEKDKADELKAQEASERRNWYYAIGFGALGWIAGFGVSPAISLAATAMAANSLTTSNQSALAKTSVGDWQRTAGSKTQFVEKNLQRHAKFHALSAAVGIPILGSVIQGTSFLGALKAIWDGCEIIDQAVEKGLSPIEGRRIAEKVSIYSQSGTSLKVGIARLRSSRSTFCSFYCWNWWRNNRCSISLSNHYKCIFCGMWWHRCSMY